jgi:hypothetical protein
MYDYGRLVFLDNQKTGSTYVSQFLQECCVLEHVKSHKHRAVRNDFRADAVYFSTVRHPVDLYISLFQYGCERRGSTFKALRQIGRGGLYKSMPRWLNFILNEENAAVFADGYEQFAPLGIGVMSYRAMRITLRQPTVTLAAATSYDQLIDIWSKKNIATHIFRQESLNASLDEFATKTVPEFFDQEAVHKFLHTAERINSSQSRGEIKINRALRARIMEKERFLIERFYPATAETKPVAQPEAAAVQA